MATYQASLGHHPALTFGAGVRRHHCIRGVTRARWHHRAHHSTPAPGDRTQPQNTPLFT